MSAVPAVQVSTSDVSAPGDPVGSPRADNSPGGVGLSARREPLGSPGADSPQEWVRVCLLRDLLVERGVAALVAGTQVALFRLSDDTVRAVQQRDPYSGANVMSRGIVGTRGGVPTVAGPMYKQVFDLTTGRCLEAVGFTPVEGLAPDLVTWPVEVRDGVVHVGTTGVPGMLETRP